MYFSTFFDEGNEIFDTVSFPDTADRYPLQSKGILLCYGRVVEVGYISLNLKWISRQETAGDSRMVEINKIMKKNIQNSFIKSNQDFTLNPRAENHPPLKSCSYGL